jgi:hypothetical protein
MAVPPSGNAASSRHPSCRHPSCRSPSCLRPAHRRPRHAGEGRHPRLALVHESQAVETTQKTLLRHEFPAAQAANHLHQPGRNPNQGVPPDWPVLSTGRVAPATDVRTPSRFRTSAPKPIVQDLLPSKRSVKLTHLPNQFRRESFRTPIPSISMHQTQSAKSCRQPPRRQLAADKRRPCKARSRDRVDRPDGRAGRPHKTPNPRFRGSSL